eukprot:scaffold7104_cov129-Isochrysis_galbana.AAC.3
MLSCHRQHECHPPGAARPREGRVRPGLACAPAVTCRQRRRSVAALGEHGPALPRGSLAPAARRHAMMRLIQLRIARAEAAHRSSAGAPAPGCTGGRGMSHALKARDAERTELAVGHLQPPPRSGHAWGVAARVRAGSNSAPLQPQQRAVRPRMPVGGRGLLHAPAAKRRGCANEKGWLRSQGGPDSRAPHAAPQLQTRGSAALASASPRRRALQSSGW